MVLKKILIAGGLLTFSVSVGVAEEAIPADKSGYQHYYKSVAGDITRHCLRYNYWGDDNKIETYEKCQIPRRRSGDGHHCKLVKSDGEQTVVALGAPDPCPMGVPACTHTATPYEYVWCKHTPGGGQAHLDVYYYGTRVGRYDHPESSLPSGCN